MFEGCSGWFRIRLEIYIDMDNSFFAARFLSQTDAVAQFIRVSLLSYNNTNMTDCQYYFSPFHDFYHFKEKFSFFSQSVVDYYP